MHGSRERHVIRWDAHCALLDREIERLFEALALAVPGSPHAADLSHQLAAAQTRRRALGPSPRHKMG